MKIETKYDEGEEVLVQNKFKGKIAKISIKTHAGSKDVDYRIDDMWYPEEELDPLTVKNKKTLYQALTGNLHSQAMIIKNLGVISKTKEELAAAEKILKDNLKIEVGEVVRGDFVEISKYNRTTMSYEGCKLYDDAVKEVKKAEDFLKLSKMGKTKTIEVIAVKKI